MRTVYKLGPFLLDTEAPVLTHDGVATALGARGATVLATAEGATLSEEEAVGWRLRVKHAAAMSSGADALDPMTM